MTQLTASQYERLHAATLAAYPDENDLTMMLQFRLGIALAMIKTGGASYPFTVFKLIEKRQALSKAHELVAALREDRPDDPELARLAAELGLAVAAPGGLELMISERNGMLDPVAWRAGLARIETQVCRVEYRTARGGTVNGTAFLVGPDVVLTNYHVVEPLIDGRADPGRVRLLFDFKQLGALEVNPGVPHGLSADRWLVDSSRYSPLDEQPVAGEEPPRELLDYALLRLDGAVGDATVGKEGRPLGRKRGWIELREQPPAVDQGELLFIVQHPQDQPVRLAIGTVSKKLGTRVRYQTNTDKGSSGSPCFDIDWKLAALHHSGDPNYQPFIHDTYNQGIPIGLVRALIDEHGHADELAPIPA